VPRSSPMLERATESDEGPVPVKGQILPASFHSPPEDFATGAGR
jgi:hypothetical protein